MTENQNTNKHRFKFPLILKLNEDARKLLKGLNITIPDNEDVNYIAFRADGTLYPYYAITPLTRDGEPMKAQELKLVAYTDSIIDF